MAFMIILQNIHTFNCRSEKKSVFRIPINSNIIFLIGIIGSLLLGVAVLEVKALSMFLKTTPIPMIDLLKLLGLGFIILFIMECYKIIKYRS